MSTITDSKVAEGEMCFKQGTIEGLQSDYFADIPMDADELMLEETEAKAKAEQILNTSDHEARTKEVLQKHEVGFECVVSDEIIQDYEPVPVKYLVEGIVPAEGMTVIGAFWKSFKSIIADEIGYSVASGTPAFNYLPTIQGTVLYFDLENGKTRALNRAKLIREGKNIQLTVPFFVTTGQSLFLDDAKSVEKILVPYIEKFRPALIIFDSLSRFLSRPSENASADMRQVHNNLYPLMEKYHFASLLLHHTDKKQGVKRAWNLRGSGELCAAASSILMLERNEKENCVKVLHDISRDDEVAEPFKINLTFEKDRITLIGFPLSKKESVIEACQKEIIASKDKLKGYFSLAKAKELQPSLTEYTDDSIRDSINALSKAGLLTWNGKKTKGAEWSFPQEWT